MSLSMRRRQARPAREAAPVNAQIPQEAPILCRPPLSCASSRHHPATPRLRPVAWDFELPDSDGQSLSTCQLETGQLVNDPSWSDRELGCSENPRCPATSGVQAAALPSTSASSGVKRALLLKLSRGCLWHPANFDESLPGGLPTADRDPRRSVASRVEFDRRQSRLTPYERGPGRACNSW